MYQPSINMLMTHTKSTRNLINPYFFTVHSASITSDSLFESLFSKKAPHIPFKRKNKILTSIIKIEKILVREMRVGEKGLLVIPCLCLYMISSLSLGNYT